LDVYDISAIPPVSHDCDIWILKQRNVRRRQRRWNS